MDADVSALCGPKGKHDPDRIAVRHGREQGSVTLGWAPGAGAAPAGARRRRLGRGAGAVL